MRPTQRYLVHSLHKGVSYAAHRSAWQRAETQKTAGPTPQPNPSNKYPYRIEKTYVGRVRRNILFHNKRHPRDVGWGGTHPFLPHLAVEHNAALSTQNQALHAILLLYREVLGQPIDPARRWGLIVRHDWVLLIQADRLADRQQCFKLGGGCAEVDGIPCGGFLADGRKYQFAVVGAGGGEPADA